MRAWIDDEGALHLHPVTEMESVALKHWAERMVKAGGIDIEHPSFHKRAVVAYPVVQNPA